MRKTIKLFIGLFMTVSLSVLLAGCSRDTQKRSEDDLKDVENNVQEKIGDHFTYSRDDVDEAISYIHKNIDNIDQEDVANKIYEKAYYIEQVAKQSDTQIDNDLTKYATQAKEYARDVYLADEDEMDDIVEKGKSQFEDFKTRFETDKDKFIDDFSNFFK